jgi:hypothetical protein
VTSEKRNDSGKLQARLGSDFRSWESQSSLVSQEEGKALSGLSLWRDHEDSWLKCEQMAVL